MVLARRLKEDTFTFSLTFQRDNISCEFIDTLARGEQALSYLENLTPRLFGFDTETCVLDKYTDDPEGALNPLISRIRLIQLYDDIEKKAWVFDLNHIPISLFEKIFIIHRHIAHWAIFDLQFLLNQNIVPKSLGCTHLIFKLLLHASYPTDEIPGSLQNLVKTYLEVDLKKGVQDSNWGDELTFEQIEYAAIDSVATYKLGEYFAPRLKQLKLERVYKLYKDVQIPIARMMLHGIKVNKEHHVSLLRGWRQELVEAKRKLCELVPDINVNSAKDIGEWLEKTIDPEILNSWPRSEETGRLKVDATTLSEFNFLDFVAPFHEYQTIKKLTSTYGTALLEKISPVTDRLHGKFTINGARTGRMTANEPNLQNLPRRKDIRASFIAEEGNVLVCADFSQIELRVAAEISRDKEMLSAYKKGIDLHRITAAKVSRKKIEDVTNEERQFGKSLGFGLIFGLGAAKFITYARKGYGVEVTLLEAMEAKTNFFSLYDGYKTWMKEQTTTCEESLIAKTACGKIRRLHSDYYYGQALNTPIQGSAAEVMMYALIFLDNVLRNLEVPARIVNVVHDEILVECREDAKDLCKDLLRNAMEKAMLEVFPKASINKLVEVRIGKNWAEAK